MFDPTEEQIMDEFFNWLDAHPNIKPIDLGVVPIYDVTPFGVREIITVDAILKSNYYEIANRAEPEVIN